MFDNLESYFNSLKFSGLAQGYYPDPTKINLIVHLNNLILGELFGSHNRFRFCTGTPYIVSYIGDNKSKGDWLKKRIIR